MSVIPLIGLDIDHVLSTTETRLNRPTKEDGLDLTMREGANFRSRTWAYQMACRMNGPSLEALRWLLEKSQAHILVTSNHRHYFSRSEGNPAQEMSDALGAFLPGVFVGGMTPYRPHLEGNIEPRGEEIRAWFEGMPVGSPYRSWYFVGIDDLGKENDGASETTNYSPFEGQLVKTLPSKGLTMEGAREALRILRWRSVSVDSRALCDLTHEEELRLFRERALSFLNLSSVGEGK